MYQLETQRISGQNTDQKKKRVEIGSTENAGVRSDAKIGFFGARTVIRLAAGFISL